MNKNKYIDGRTQYAINYIPLNCDNILDAGCSSGYSTINYLEYSNKITGIDITEEDIKIAKSNYPSIEFYCGSLDKIPEKNNSFNCIICTDVLEHVEDEVAVLNEFYRVLDDEGILIITTPHKGLFHFIDPYNFQYYLRKYGYFIYAPLYRLFKKSEPKSSDLSNEYFHRHYKLKDFLSFLDKSDFKEKYNIVNVNRTGLILDPISYWISHFTPLVLGYLPNFVLNIIKILHLEYNISFGALAYNIGIVIQKKTA